MQYYYLCDLLINECSHATLNGYSVISIVSNAGEWTGSAIGYEALTPSAGVAKSTISIDSCREPKSAEVINRNLI